MRIENASELQDIDLDDQIELKSDIEITEDFTPISKFNGVFNGNGHTVSGLNGTFIKKVKSNAILQDVTFKDVKLDGNSKGIFKENYGEIQSVTIKDITRTSLSEDQERDLGTCSSDISDTISDTSTVYFNQDSEELIQNSIGCLVGVNLGQIDACKVSGLDIDYVSPLEQEWSGIGVISGISINGKVTDCVVDGNSVKNSISEEWSVVGVICGIAFNTVFDGCKSMNFSNSNQKQSVFTVSGIVGFGESVTITDSVLHTWEVSNFNTFVGFSLLLRDSTVKNCRIDNIDAERLSSFKLVKDITGVVKDCAIRNCTLNSIKTDKLVFSFSETGVVDGCFARDIRIKAKKLQICSKPTDIKNSWMDVNVEITESVDIESDSSSFYARTVMKEEQSADTLKVSCSSDLKDVTKNTTIELIDDIDLCDTNPLNLDIFTGDLHGNGHSISNLSGCLFSVVNGALIEDIILKNPNINGKILAESIAKSTVRSVEIQKENMILESTQEDISVVEKAKSSTIKDFSIHLSLDNDELSFYGICRYLQNSTISDCNVDVVVKACRNFNGISNVMKNNSSIKNCHCSGEVNADIMKGLVWNVTDSDIRRSSNDIVATSNTKTSSIIGGICCRNHNSVIKNCEFSGSITCTAEVGPIGGICGQMFDKNSRTEKCVNTGDINSKSNQVGGIVGRLGDGEVKYAENYGSVSGINYIGGIVGICNLHEDAETTPGRHSNTNTIVNITKSKNHGSVSGTKFVGGLVGFMDNTDLENCYTEGSVKGDECVSLTVGDFIEDNCTVKIVLVKPSDQNPEDLNIGRIVDSDMEEIMTLINV